MGTPATGVPWCTAVPPPASSSSSGSTTASGTLIGENRVIGRSCSTIGTGGSTSMPGRVRGRSRSTSATAVTTATGTTTTGATTDTIAATATATVATTADPRVRVHSAVDIPVRDPRPQRGFLL